MTQILERLSNYSSLVNELIRSQLSAWTVGNPAGIGNNLVGKRLIRAAREARGADWRFTDNAAAELERDGYVRLGDIYDRPLVERLSAELDAAMNDPGLSAPSNQAVERGNPDASRYLIDPISAISDLRLLINDRVETVLKAYFGGHFQWTQTVVYRTFHIEDQTREFYSNIWHYDRMHTAYLQLFVYLSPDVTMNETGAFRIHTRDFSRKIMRAGFFHRRIVTAKARRMLEDPDRVDCIEGTIGTPFIAANAWCLHRAGVPSAGRHRDVAVFSLIPSERPFEGVMKTLPNG